MADGKYNYCFSNEGWTSNSKEVSFNVHGIVYVPESEMSKDPLETEGKRGKTLYEKESGIDQLVSFSSQALRGFDTGEG
jgi:hypothetical protein